MSLAFQSLRFRVLVLWWLVLAVNGCARPTPVVSQVKDSPVTLPGLTETASLRWPTIAVSSDTVFVAGNVFRSNPLSARPAYLGRLRQDAGGRLVPLGLVDLPPGDFQFAYPRIAAAGNKLHLVWGEFASRPRTVDAWLVNTNFEMTLWHATLDRGVWSHPETIVTSRWFGWSGETGGIVVDASGALHVAVWNGETGRVHDYRMVGTSWEESRLPYGGLNQTTAITTIGDTVVVALVDGARDPAQVVIVESRDRGTHWVDLGVASQRPRLEGSVSRLAFAPTAEGLLLAIGEKPSNSLYLDTIRVLRLGPKTGSSAKRFIMPPPMVDGFEFAGVSCGSAVMLLRTFSGLPQLFALTLSRDSSARVIRPLLANARVATYPGLAVGQRSAIAVFGYDTAANTPWRSVAMSVPLCSP
jgi:hypothetical protein